MRHSHVGRISVTTHAPAVFQTWIRHRRSETESKLQAVQLYEASLKPLLPGECGYKDDDHWNNLPACFEYVLTIAFAESESKFWDNLVQKLFECESFVNLGSARFACN